MINLSFVLEVLELFDDALADTHVNCYNEVVEKVSNVSKDFPLQFI